MSTERVIYGQTGEIGKDGLLTQEQRVLLNNIQEKAAINALNYLDNMKEGELYPMVAMATGIGKGRIIHKIIEREMERKQDQKVILIAGTKLVLVKQTHEALSGYKQESSEDNYVESEEDDELRAETTLIEDDLLDNQKSFLYKTGKIRQQDANVHVGTIQTVQSEVNRVRINPDDYGLEIVDEVHNIGTPKRKTVVQKFKRVIGFTATPHRHSGRMKSPEQYGFKVIEPLPLPEAQKLRLLPPLLGIQADTKNLIDEIPTTSTGKIDYTMLEKLLKKSPTLRPFITDRVSKIVSDGDRRYKTIIVVNFVWEAEELAQLLSNKGIKVGIAVNKQASKEIHTEEIPALDSIERYKLPESDDKSIQVLISPYVASEGFDAPFTEVLVWASPTDSELRYTQYTGRLARRNEGKLFGLIVDFLYQTNKYGWNYNMAMWMKDDVKQLENGMLWLGPETDIESLKRLPQVEAMKRQADVKPLADLQREGLLEVQDTDFPITATFLYETFIGEYRVISPIAQDVVNALRQESEEMFVKRLNKTRIVEVALDRERFIKEMLARGAVLKTETNSIEDLKPTDFPLTASALRSAFIGGEGKIRPVAEAIMQDEEFKAMFVKRRSGNNFITVCTNKGRFIAIMLERGVKIRKTELENIKPSDLTITGDFLKSRFIGSESKLISIAKKVVEKLLQEDSSQVEQARSGSHVVTVVKDTERFSKMMESYGVVVRSNVPEVKTNDFAITATSLAEIFRGNYADLMEIVKHVIEVLQTEDSSLVGKGKKGKSSFVTVVHNRERFIQEMVARGAHLKP